MNEYQHYVGLRRRKHEWVFYPLSVYGAWFLANYRLEAEVYDAYVDAIIMGMDHEAAVEVALKSA